MRERVTIRVIEEYTVELDDINYEDDNVIELVLDHPNAEVTYSHSEITNTEEVI